MSNTKENKNNSWLFPLILVALALLGIAAGVWYGSHQSACETEHSCSCHTHEDCAHHHHTTTQPSP